MRLTLKDQRGVGAFEIVLLVLVLLIAGALAYAYVQSLETPTQPSEAQKKTTSSVRTSDQKATDIVHDAYHNYRSTAFASVGANPTQAVESFKAMTTGEIAQKVDEIAKKGLDPVFCTKVNQSVESDDMLIDVAVSNAGDEVGSETTKNVSVYAIFKDKSMITYTLKVDTDKNKIIDIKYSNPECSAL